MTLPIDAIRDAIDGALMKRTRLVVTAPTGSGKSTRLPLWMRDALEGPILIVEPRRVACRSLASFLAEQSGTRLGDEVGYRVRFEDHSSARTTLLFVTPGVALRMLSDAATPGRWRGVLIDEFHERGWEMDLVVTLLQVAETIPMVLTSATIEGEAIAQTIHAQHIHAPGRAFDVEIRHHGSAEMPTSRDLDARVRAALGEALEEDEGDVLVFLPGKGEIRACLRALEPLAARRDVVLVEVHGGLPTARLTDALRATASRRRVFLATNVAETSLTLPGVTTVIDSGLARQRIHRAGRNALALMPIARASMDQRAGRAGRVAAGRCLRLWIARFQPQETTPPEVERSELDDLVLTAASCGLYGADLEGAPWPTPPPEFALTSARRRLHALGALDARGALTSLGERLSTLPVGAHEARMLVDPPAGLAGWVADLVALLQRRADLFLATYHMESDARTRIDDARRALLAGCEDEVSAQLRCLRRGHVRRHRLHESGLREARRMSRSLRQRLGITPTDPTREPEDEGVPREALARFLLDRLPESGFVLRPRAAKRRRPDARQRSSGEPWSNGEVEVFVSAYQAPFEVQGDASPTSPVAGVLLSHVWIGDRALGVRGVGRMLLPCSLQDLAHARVGELEVERPEIQRRRGGPRVLAACVRRLAGVTLESSRSELEGAPLREAAAALILEGRLIKGGAARLLDALHLWKIFYAWPDRLASQAPPEDPLAFLIERLHTLGLEENAELGLIGPMDLCPGLAEMTGLDPDTLERWLERFPRQWTHQGSTYDCKVSPRGKRVILTPNDRASGRGAPPDARFLPRFDGFRVEYRKASRRLVLRE